MNRWLTRSCAAMLLVCCGAAAAGEEPKLVEPVSVRKLVADGKHNAFTALVRWKDQFWLSFRSGPSHGYGEADLVLMRSSDAENWSEVRRINILPDDRDPQFLATPERLFLYAPCLKNSTCTSYVLHTDDGEQWSQPRPVYQPQFIFWKPLVHAGRFYATAHKKVESSAGKTAREVHLIASDDGLAWNKISTIRRGNWESETTLHFAGGGKLLAFIRTKYSVPGHIMESQPPYETWSQRPAGVHLSGHSVHTFGDTTYLFSRTMDAAGKQQGTLVYTLADGQLQPYCNLPSGGDCSYPEAVELGGEMLVSYYSSHEGPANIYLARVPLKK